MQNEEVAVEGAGDLSGGLDKQNDKEDISAEDYLSSQESAEEGELELTQEDNDMCDDQGDTYLEGEEGMMDEELVDNEDEVLSNEKAEMDRIDKIFEEKTEELSRVLNINPEAIESALKQQAEKLD